LSLLALVPVVVLVVLVDSLRTALRDRPLREHVFGAAVLAGTAVALATELMSAFRALTFAGIAGFWFAAAAATGAANVWCRSRFGAPDALRLPALEGADRALAGAVVTLAAVLLVVAWLSPPQSSDSIGYHMARVMHWIQNGSLAHYPTADPPQLFEPPFAEMVRLHLQLLSGGDRAGCLLQWFAAMGSLAGASLVARDLGGARRAQILAAVFAVSLPIGITQASSGKNGWVESFWLLALVHFGTTIAPGATQATPGRMLAAFGALALELTTKISGWLFAPPFVLLAMWHTIRRAPVGERRLGLVAVAGSLLVLAVASPYLVRNVSLYGHPLVDPVFRDKSGLQLVTPAAVASNAVRSVLYQFGTGVDAVDSALMSAAEGLHGWIGLSVSDSRTTQFGPFRIEEPTRVEERAFSPLHISLLFAGGAALVASARLRAGGVRAPYLAALLSAFVLYNSAVQWQPPSCRLLMPLLVLAAPLVAVVMTEALRARTVVAWSLVLLAACLPYVVGTKYRPLSFDPGTGLLATPREDLYFARKPRVRDSYRRLAQEIRRLRTKELGVAFRRDSEPEYLLWMLLADSAPAVRIRNVLVSDASAGLAGNLPSAKVPPERIAVFDPSWDQPEFEESIDVDGTEYRLLERFGSAALYEPARPGGPGFSRRSRAGRPAVRAAGRGTPSSQGSVRRAGRAPARQPA
jgi:hypothetical protein